MVDRALMFSYSGAIVFTSEDYYFGICRLTWAEVDWEKCGKNSRIFDRQKDEDEFFEESFRLAARDIWKVGKLHCESWHIDILLCCHDLTVSQFWNDQLKKITIIASWSQCDNLSPPQKLMDFSKEKISCQLWFADQIEFN